MDVIVKPTSFDLIGEHVFKENYESFYQDEQLHWKIKQLLKKANDAKDKGQWGKAQELLYKVRMMTNSYRNK